MEKVTPMMAQYKSLKEVAKSALLLFRMGDFYETFYEDAKTLAEHCEVTLTKRGGVPMSGVPWHTIEGYIDRLIAKGVSVAIADQVEDAKEAKGLVKRAIVRTITPGTTTSSQLLSAKENHYIISLARVGAIFGLAVCDVSTGEFKVIEFDDQEKLLTELLRLQPKEIVTYPQFREKNRTIFEKVKNASLTLNENYSFEHKAAYKSCQAHLQVNHLDGLGLKGMVAAINAAGGLISYLKEELHLPLKHVRTIFPYTTHEQLQLDNTTREHLELTESYGKTRKNSLLSIIDKTNTPMGARRLTQWLKKPLLSVEAITERQDGVEMLALLPMVNAKLATSLNQVKDCERLMMKVSAGWATAVDLVAIRQSLQELPKIKAILRPLTSTIFSAIDQELVDLTEVCDSLSQALVDEPPQKLSEGGLFRKGYNEKLDELSKCLETSKDFLAKYQAELREELGIKTLKVSYNKIFGYYLEVSKKQSPLLADRFEKKQTLVNTERFTSPKLKEYELEVLTAQERKEGLEKSLFAELIELVNRHFDPIAQVTCALASLDAISSLARVGRENQWCRPKVDNSSLLEITEGRHPVVESCLAHDSFIPNETRLDGDHERLMLLTGPNMAGKSTYIRQVALITILAQMGSLVPATKAHIGVVDQIFTRIGASDDLSRGQSTFMVEMAETASILRNATSRSLVILDEIGRGTSTYDGLSIAWSVAEYLLLTPSKMAKTLFATHYFELTELEKMHEGVVNASAQVEDAGESITFLYTIQKGCANKSYGIHAAKLAQMPHEVITRAEAILSELQKKNANQKFIPKVTKAKEKQLLLFE